MSIGSKWPILLTYTLMVSHTSLHVDMCRMTHNKCESAIFWNDWQVGKWHGPAILPLVMSATHPHGTSWSLSANTSACLDPAAEGVSVPALEAATEAGMAIGKRQLSRVMIRGTCHLFRGWMVWLMINDPVLDFEKSAFFRALSARFRAAIEYSHRIISDPKFRYAHLIACM